MMLDEYDCPVPCDVTVAFESPISESRLLNITNTEVLDACESTQRLGDQMEDYFEKEVVLDSDDELGDSCGAVSSANERFPSMGMSSGRGATRLLRRRHVSAGCFRRLDKKVSEHVHLDSTRSDRSDGESKPGRTRLYNGNRFQKHHVVVDSAVSMLGDQKAVSMNQVDPDFLNPVRKSSTEESLEERKLSSDEYKHMDMGKVTNYNFSLPEFNYAESFEDAESQDKALRFVDHYLSVNDIGSYRDVQNRKTNITKSPPPLRSKGSQSLAMRVNLESSASKLKAFDWTEKQMKEDEHASPRMNEDLIFESKDDNSGWLCYNEESDNVNLHNKISNLQSKEKMPGSTLSSNDSEYIGSNSEIYIVYDSMEFDEQLDAGLYRDDVKKVEELSDVPDALDIGLDTQVAAEAMEELMHTVPPRFDTYLTHKGSDTTLMDNKCESNHVAKYGEIFVGWRSKGKRSKCMKISDVQGKAKSWSAVKRNGKSIASTAITFQQEENGLNGQGRLKEFQRYSRRSKRTTDDNKHGSSMRSEEMFSFHEEAHTCLKSNFSSSSEVKRDTAKTEEHSNMDGGNWTFPKLNLWVYPKRKRTQGKRTLQHTPLLSISSSTECSPFEKCPAVNDGQIGLPKLLVYNRRRQFPLARDQRGSSLKLSVDLSSSVDTNKPTSLCAKLDNLKPSSLDASNGHSMTSQLLEGTGKRNQPSNSLPRSPLMKELTRLGYTGLLPDFLPKDSRRKRAMEKICILFSKNLEEGTVKQQKKIIARLGLSIASCCSNATHFVADRFVRTRNMLEAIALGKPVVTHLWLENCEQAGYVIAEKSYILRDEKKEKEIGFNMAVSLSRAIKLPLLKGRRVLVTPNVKPSIDVINSLIKAVQGQSLLIDKMKDKLILDDVLIISCKEDYTVCLQFLEKGACIYDSELLLNGIVTQKLEYDRNRLFEDLKENGHSCHEEKW